MNLFVTGGAGFIGSTFCDSALSRGHAVTCFDDFSTGKELFLAEAGRSDRFRLVRADIRDLPQIHGAMEAARPDWVAHFAANADVRRGTERTRRDLEINTIGTWTVLEAMRLAGASRLLFTSTGSVYGEPAVFPTPEDAPFPEQTSLYGASKLAGEGLVSAYSHGFGMTGVVFRLVSVLGPRYTHGHVFDFVRGLRRDPTRLDVLGDGNQTKSYLHVQDLIAGFWTAIERARSGPSVYNIGHDDTLIVRESVRIICAKLGVSPDVVYGGGTRGWVGDSPRIQLDTRKIRALGWAPRHGLPEAVSDTVEYLLANPELFG